MGHTEERRVWVQTWKPSRLRPQVYTWSYLQFNNFLQLRHEGTGRKRTPLGLEGWRREYKELGRSDYLYGKDVLKHGHMGPQIHDSSQLTSVFWNSEFL